MFKFKFFTLPNESDVWVAAFHDDDFKDLVARGRFQLLATKWEHKGRIYSIYMGHSGQLYADGGRKQRVLDKS